MKKFLCAVIIVCLLFSLTACVTNPTKLGAPQNVRVSKSGLITWDAVANATGYVVTINSQQYDVTATEFQAPNVKQSFTCSVVAVAQGYDKSDESTATFTYVPSPPIIPPDEEDFTLAISGSSEVRKGNPVTLKARVNGEVSKLVTWSVVEGDEYVSVSDDGVVTVIAQDAESDHIVRVKATSTEDTSKSAEHVMRVLARTKLTQEMLDVFNNVDRAGFEGYVSIELYSPGAIGDVLQGTYVNTVQTAMDGENWYARYDSTGAGLNQSMYVKNKDGLAQQISVSLMNDEEYFPMKDDYGSEISWTDSGMYNSFKNLKVKDFEFDEETWNWTYKYSDSDFVRHVIASANPYEFDPTGLSLIIEDGEVMGIYSESVPSRRVVPGYTAKMKLFVVINQGDKVEIPKISKYSHEDIHDELQTAINNMRALSSYKLDFVEKIYTMATPNGRVSGYEETVTPDECFFRPYNLVVRDGQTEREFIEGSEYGFRSIRENFYNSYTFDGKTQTYRAGRAFTENFTNAKASFAFAPEIFRAYYVDEETNETTYYVDEIMCHVASAWYKAPGNDYALYGLYATNYLYSVEKYLPYVSINNGYITEVGFFFNLGDMYGDIKINYSDFNTAKLDDDHSDKVQFETREIPVSWTQLDIQVSTGDTSNDESKNAAEVLTERFGSADAIPFFGEVLGDSYGFGLTTSYLPSGGNRMYDAIVFYYDVPLDADYTVKKSIDAVKRLLADAGFTQNAAGEFSKGDICIFPTEQGQDFNIYVWKVN